MFLQRPTMEMHVVLLLTTAIVGFISLSKTLTTFCTWVWVHFLRPPKNLKEYGSWALVTGSTDGIGKALALELASKGLNLILVARNPTKLKSTSNQIYQRFGGGLHVRCVLVDFSNDSSEVIAKKIKEGIQGLDVGILVNNVGTTYSWPRFFHEVDLELDDIIKVNLEGTTTVTRTVLPVMLKKKRGAIINVGSASSTILPSFPLYATYSATKAYIHQLSRSLHMEYKQHGIHVQCQIPMMVETKMVPVKKSSLKTTFFLPTPEEYSKTCLRWIGYDPICMPYWRHSIEAYLLQAVPVLLFDEFFFKYLLRWYYKSRRFT